MYFTICDVFTDRPLEGNQLAVFGDGAGVPDALQQRLAREINFSETVYVYPPDDPANTARIRIYVPTAEIPFAGHPVVGTAVVLAGQRDLTELVLETGAGRVEVTVAGNFATMSQPIPTVEPFAHADELLAVLGVKRSELPVEVYDNGMAHIYVVLESREAVAALDPDMAALARLQLSTGNEGSGFNCFGGSGTEWKTRMFAPAQISGEDPATGSAAGPLACHLMRHGLVDIGTEITISQGAEIGRPSTLYAKVEGSSPDAITAVKVSGHAVVVGDGQFTIS
jgi:trans-2,3-dihydro-3-hydroxyanthranilate isomerase